MLLTNAQEAGLTRSQRSAKGKYQTPRQKRAFAKYLAGAELTKQELEILATNPYLRPIQRQRFAALAEAA